MSLKNFALFAWTSTNVTTFKAKKSSSFWSWTSSRQVPVLAEKSEILSPWTMMALSMKTRGKLAWNMPSRAMTMSSLELKNLFARAPHLQAIAQHRLAISRRRQSTLPGVPLMRQLHLHIHQAHPSTVWPQPNTHQRVQPTHYQQDRPDIQSQLIGFVPSLRYLCKRWCIIVHWPYFTLSNKCAT